MIHVLIRRWYSFLSFLNIDGISIRSHGFSYIRLQEVGQIFVPANNLVLSVDTQYALLSYRSVLQEVLEQKPTFRCLKQDVLPYLVRTQLVSWIRSLQMRLTEIILIILSPF